MPALHFYVRILSIVIEDDMTELFLLTFATATVRVIGSLLEVETDVEGVAGAVTL